MDLGKSSLVGWSVCGGRSIEGGPAGGRDGISLKFYHFSLSTPSSFCGFLFFRFRVHQGSSCHSGSCHCHSTVRDCEPRRRARASDASQVSRVRSWWSNFSLHSGGIGYWSCDTWCPEAWVVDVPSHCTVRVSPRVRAPLRS